MNEQMERVRKLLGDMTEEELLDYRGEMSDAAAPYLERIRAVDAILANRAPLSGNEEG